PKASGPSLLPIVPATGAPACCAGQAAQAGAVDPVCGMTVQPETAAGSAEFEGRTYYFCSQHCVHKFQADPRRYLGEAPAPAPVPAGANVEYTCPMHPEVVSDHPASCPKCGMALEPRTATAEEGPNPELADMSERLRIGILLTVPLLVLTMGEMIPGWPLHLHDWWGFNVLQFGLATPVVLV